MKKFIIPAVFAMLATFSIFPAAVHAEAGAVTITIAA